MVDVNVNFVLEEQEPYNAEFTVNPDVTYVADMRVLTGTRDHTELYNRDVANQHPMSAITGLEEALSNEATARENADTQLQNNIDAEVLRATTAENNLDTKIEAETLRAESVEGQLSDDIVAENTRALSAEETLQNNINTEETRAKGVENQLRNDLTAETTRAETAETTLTTNLNSEISTRVSEISRVEGLIAAEEERATNVESDLQSDISSEASTRASEITRVEGLISAETSRATGIENTLRDDLTSEATARQNADTTLQNNIDTLAATVSSNYTTLDNKISMETTNRENADNNLQSQIDAITASSDVTDIVGTYAQLQTYDTSTLAPNSIIKVLQDENRNNETTYYRWVITGGVGSWVLIGEEGPYYTKSESDTRFVNKNTTINNKPLSSNIILTATDVGALPNTTIIGDGSLDIQVNGTSIGTFTANQSGNTTANIVVPDSATWGNIEGTLSDQTDLQTALDTKQNLLTSENAGNCIEIAIGSPSELPAEYQEVEYLDSTGTQCIDTGITPTATKLRIVTKCQRLADTKGGDYLGSVTSSTPRAGFRLFNNNTSGGLVIQATTSIDFQSSVTDIFDCDITVIQNTSCNYKINNISNTIQNNTINLTYNKSIILYGFHFGNNISINNIPQRFWGFTVYKEDILVQNLVPARRKSDGVLGMYDTVSGDFLTNAGTGTFIAGRDVEEATKISFVNDAGYITSADLPTVNDGTLTINQNNTPVGSFSANSSTNTTVNITVPTDTSDLTNNAGFITNSALSPYALSADLAEVATTGDYEDLINKPTIPTVNDGTLTIQANSQTIGTFTANQSGDTTVDITIPDSATWGNITGDIADQADLQRALGTKQNILTQDNAGPNISIISGSGGKETISGTTSIELKKAINDGLSSVTVYGNCEQRILPIGYKRVASLTTDGVAHLVTPYNPYSVDRVQGTVSFTQLVTGSGLQYVVGGRTGSASSGAAVGYCVYAPSHGGLTYYPVSWKDYSVGMSVTTGVDYVFDTTIVAQGTIKLIINDSVRQDTTMTNTKGVSTGTNKVCLFSLIGNYYNQEGTTLKDKLIFYGTDGEILAYYIFVERKSDNALGIFNLIDGSFITNDEGTFTKGEYVTDTPTPTNPVPIWCNNGKLKGGLSSGLPLGFTRVEYLGSNGTQYIDTGIIIDDMTYKITTDVMITASTNQVLFGSMNTSSGYPGLMINDKGGFRYGTQQPEGLPSTLSVGEKHKLELSYKKLVVDNTQTYNATGTTLTTPLTYSLYLFGRNNVGVAGSFSSCRFYDWQIEKDNDIVANFIPCRRNSDSELGMYDTVTDRFLTNIGSGTFIAGADVSDNVIVYADGITETVTDSLNNTATAEMLLGLEDKKDSQELLGGNIVRNVGIKVLDGTEAWATLNGGRGYYVRFADTVGIPYSHQSYCTHFRFVSWTTQTTPMENNCFAYNKDGGSSVANGNITFKPDLTVYNTVEKFKQFLAEQYNNGTPAIIVFPLVTSTSETVTGQTLTTVDGDNVLTITQASINNLPISAKYTTSGSTVINFVNDSGFITGINGSDVINALGYTPYDSNNPEGYIKGSDLTPYALNDEVVHNTGTEDIGGSKTFTSAISQNITESSQGRIITTLNDIQVGTSNPQENYMAGIVTKDGDGNEFANINTQYRTDGQVRAYFFVTNPVTGGGQQLGIINSGGVSWGYAPNSDVDGSIVTTASKFKSSNGYFKLGNGLIVQWGGGSVAANASSVTITFPTPFTTTNYTPVPIHNGGVNALSISSRTTTSFVVNYSSTSTAIRYFYWQAIGY